MTIIMLETNKKTLDFQSPNNLDGGFNKSIDSLNLGSSKIKTAYKNSIIEPNTFANFQAEPTRLAFSPLKKIEPIKTTAPSSNMLMPTQFRAPYRIGERIGQYKGNDVIFKTDKTAQINGKTYNLPQAAIDLNKKGNGIGILRSVNYWIAHPEAIAKAYNGEITVKKQPKVKPAPLSLAPNPLNDFLKMLNGGLALKFEIGNYKITFAVSLPLKDIKAALEGRLNPDDAFKHLAGSLTINKILERTTIAGTTHEKAQSVTVTATGGRFNTLRVTKDSFKTIGLVTGEYTRGRDINPLSGEIAAAGLKLSLKIPGSGFVINKLIDITQNFISAAVSAFPGGIVAGLAFRAIGEGMKATKPYLALEGTVSGNVALNFKDASISARIKNGPKYTVSIPKATNTLLDKVGLNKFHVPVPIAAQS
jgi:hypothetical protein